MTILLFLLGIIAVTLIARYNESNALFWKLLIAFLCGMAVAGLYNKLTSEEKNEETLTQQVCPMQSSFSVLSPFEDLLASMSEENAEDVCRASAGQVSTPAYGEIFVQSEVSGHTRDQPNNMHRCKLMRNKFYHDTS